MPKKHLGQNFLYDPFLLTKIVDAAGLTGDDTVVEIGPGPGRMTRLLAERAKRLIAIELDRSLYERLCDEFGGMPTVEIVHADALDFGYEAIGPFKVVANIPYYITTPIIFRLLEARRTLRSMTLTVQKEVAERIVAGPGGKDYGILSIMIQYFCTAELKFIVRRQSFRPVPRVDSAVIHMAVRPEPAVAVPDEKLFFSLVKTAFGQRRKTLSNSLRPFVNARAALERAGVDPARRPETLSIEEFGRLAAAMK